MIDVSVIVPVLLGVVLLFVGATLSRYTIAILGALLGAGGGYLLAPTVGSTLGVGGVLSSAAGILLGIVAGVVLTFMLLSFAVAAVSFIVGTYVGFTMLAPLMVDGAWYLELGAALGIGLILAFVGMMLTSTTMIVLTSFLGAALASRSLTASQFETARAETTIDPLVFEITSPVFLALFALGVLTQFGLFKLGYVRRLLVRLPGARMGRDRSEKGAGG